MKIKTIVSDNNKDFDKEVNQINFSKNVRATQTHIVHDAGGNIKSYVAVVYIEEV